MRRRSVSFPLCDIIRGRKRSFVHDFIQNFNFTSPHTIVTRNSQFLDEEADSLQELLFNILMHLAKKVPNRSSEQNLICQHRLQIGHLSQSLVATDMAACFGAQKERHFPLCQMGSFAMGAYVIVYFGRCHRIEVMTQRDKNGRP